MECCSKSDEKIAAGGEGEGVSDDRRGVTWLELDARDLEFVFFPDFLLLPGQLLLLLITPKLQG